MIFVTVGTQLPFDRLMRMIDEIAPQLGGEEIVAQGCGGSYCPRNFRVTDHIDCKEFESIVDEARVVISHAGVGTIISAMRRGKPIVVVARDASKGEHRNDHQKATVTRFAVSFNLRAVSTPAELLDAIRSLPVPASLSETPSPLLIDALINIIEG